jgi:antitoxin component YwqK of YwqJK toxin-antitoxin module
MNDYILDWYDLCVEYGSNTLFKVVQNGTDIKITGTQNGRVILERNYRNYKRDGQQLDYYENGALMFRGVFLEGKLVSFQSYDENSRIESKWCDDD